MIFLLLFVIAELSFQNIHTSRGINLTTRVVFSEVMLYNW